MADPPSFLDYKCSIQSFLEISGIVLFISSCSHLRKDKICMLYVLKYILKRKIQSPELSLIGKGIQSIK